MPANPRSSSRSRPASSMLRLMSDSTTRPILPTCRASPRVRSPVPPATSSARWPAFRPVSESVNCFHRRCTPNDIRSFMTSYLPATELNTARTRPAFSAQGDLLEAEIGRAFRICHRVLSSGGAIVAVLGARGPQPPAACGRRPPRRSAPGSAANWRRAAQAELVQQRPGIQPRVVAVVEFQAQGVVADRLDAADADVLLAGLQHALAGAVSRDLGGRGEHPQVLERQLETRCRRRNAPRGAAIACEA